MSAEMVDPDDQSPSVGDVAERETFGALEPGGMREAPGDRETTGRGREPPGARDRAPEDDALSRTIQREIIPRLLMAHRGDAAARDPEPPEGDAIERLVALSIGPSYEATRVFVESLRARGRSTEAVIAELLPAAARKLGEMWETDACSFVDVTVGLTRLQQLLRAYAPSFDATLEPTGAGRRVLISTMPGEQHTFGIAVVEEFFRRAEWDVLPQTPVAERSLLTFVSAGFFDVVGLSASSDAALESLPRLIAAIRAASKNQSVRVLAGGAALARRDTSAESIGADAIATDARDGLKKAEWMMRSLLRPC